MTCHAARVRDVGVAHHAVLFSNCSCPLTFADFLNAVGEVTGTSIAVNAVGQQGCSYDARRVFIRFLRGELLNPNPNPN